MSIRSLGDLDNFKKFQRLNEEKKEREKATLEQQRLQRLELESRQAAAITEAQERQKAQEQERQAAEARKKAEEEAKRENALKEAQRAREEAKREREAMTGHLDLHAQSVVLATDLDQMFEDGDGDAVMTEPP